MSEKTKKAEVNESDAVEITKFTTELSELLKKYGVTLYVDHVIKVGKVTKEEAPQTGVNGA